jgi:hypothetical protein
MKGGVVRIHLHIRVAPNRHEEFLAFCRRAFPVYEGDNDLRMELLRVDGSEDAFLEIVHYDIEEKYLEDQVRIDTDPANQSLLAEWRSLLMEPPKVVILRHQPTD